MKGYIVQWDAPTRRGWVLGSDGVEWAFGSGDMIGGAKPAIGARVVYEPAGDGDPPKAGGVQVTQLPDPEEGVLVTQVRLPVTTTIRLLLQFGAAYLVIWATIAFVASLLAGRTW